MIRVLHTIDTTGPGGAETVFSSLIQRSDPWRFAAFAAITGKGWVCDKLHENAITPIFVQSRGGFNIRYLLELIKIIRSHHIDIIQSHLFGANLYCCIAGLICRVPVVSTFHGFVDTSIEDRLMWVKCRTINFGAKKIVFVSDKLREHYLREYGFSARKSVTIYNGVNTSVFRPQRNSAIREELGLKQEHFLIGAVGNIRPAKGYEYFLKAAKLIYIRHPECRFVIVGEKSRELYENLLDLRKELNLENVFFFLGFRKNAAEILNNLDVFLLSSVSEGFSIATLEAMACNIPVVVTRSGGPEEIVIDGKNGFIVECNEGELANAVIHLIENIELRKKLTACAHSQVHAKFSLNRMVRRYQNTYESIIK